MASIKFGDIVVDMRGKIAGHVYAKNKGGSYARTWVKPVNPKTSAQLTVRNFLTSLSQAWRGLTQAQRDAWTAAAENFKRINRTADTIKLNGNALYVSLNKNLADIGVAAISTPPQPTSVGYMSALSITADVSDNSLDLTFTGVNDTNVKYKLFATPALSPGIDSPGTRYRQIGYTGANPTSPYDAAAQYNAVFGDVGPAGSKIFVKCVPVDQSTGQEGSPIQAVAVITA